MDPVPAPAALPDDEARTFARHGLVYLVARGVQLAAYVLVLPLITRILGGAEYGTIALTLVVHQVLLAVAALGLPSIVAFPIYDREVDGHERSLRMAVACLVCATLVVGLAHVTGPWWIRLLSGLDYSGAVPLAVWMVVPFTLQAALLSILQAQGRPGAFALSVITSTVGGQALGLTLLLWEPTPASYWTGLLLGSIAGAVVAGAAAGLRVVAPAALGDVVAGVRHGGPAVFHLLAFMVLAAGDRVLVDRYLGLDEAARYQVAYLVGSLGFSVLYALNNAWGPLIYGAAPDRRWPLLSRTTVQVGAAMTGLLATVALAAPVLLRLAAPTSYDPVELVPVTVIVGAAIVFDVAYLSGAHVLFRSRRTAALMVVMPLAAVVNIALNVVLIPRHDLVGAAVATLLGYLVAGAACRVAAHRVAAVPWRRGPELRLLAAAAAVVALALVLPSDGIGLALRLTLAVAVAGATAYWFTRHGELGRREPSRAPA